MIGKFDILLVNFDNSNQENINTFLEKGYNKYQALRVSQDNQII